MNVDNFDLIFSNIQEMSRYIKESKSNCEISTYHLVLDNKKEKEIIDVELIKKSLDSFLESYDYVEPSLQQLSTEPIIYTG